MISIGFCITLAVAGMVVATPLKPTASLSARQSNASPIDFVTNAHTEALALANGAIDYINANGPTVEPFATYFGIVQDPTRQLRVFQTAAGEHNLLLHPADTYGECASDSDIAAFGAYETGEDIFYCPSFYNQVPTGNVCTQRTVDQGGFRSATTLVVITEAIDGLSGSLSPKDCLSARDLASSNPDSAQENAENYACFAMQVFVNTECD